MVVVVVSGLLCLAALALLILGLVVTSGLTLIYTSIGVSIVSFLFLVLGVRQRRDELPVDAAEESAAPAGLGAVGTAAATRSAGRVAAGTQRRRAAATATVPDQDDYHDEEPAADGQPVTGAGSEERRAADDERYHEEATGDYEEDDHAEQDDYEEDYEEDEDDGGEWPAEQAPATVYIVPGRPRYHRQGCRFLAGRDADETDVDTARDEGYRPCGVCQPDDDAGVGGDADGDRAAVAGTVLVLADRDRFHRDGCRYVRDTPGAVRMRRRAAERSGYRPCGVCRP